MDDHLSDDSSDNDWSGAEELEDWTQELTDILCLFCDQTVKSMSDCLSHLKIGHNFDLIQLCVVHHMDCVDYIKLINYIRFNRPKSDEIKQLIESKVYNSDDFMKPVLSEPLDQMLTFDIESHYSEVLTNLNEDKNCGKLSEKELIDRLKKSEENVETLTKQLSEMRRLVNDCMEDEMEILEPKQNVGQLSKQEDSHYVSSYSHYSIHYDMLSDKSRTQAYEDAIVKNNHFFKDKTVLDIGCGTGILSLFAAKAGAKLVVAVDQSDVIYKAMDIAVENGLNNRIKFIKDRIEWIKWDLHDLPQKYDIIISEWMGYFLLFEGMLDSILYARDVCLNDSGLLLPNRSSLSIAGVCDKHFQKNFVSFWDDVYGFKMTSMKSDVLKEAQIESISSDMINTSVYSIKEWNLMECSLEETKGFETDFKLICKRDDSLTAIVGWFDCQFNSDLLDHKVTLSTSPSSECTHWKQTVFILKEPIVCKTDDTIDGNIKVCRNKHEIRSLIVEIVITGYEKQVYHLS